MRLFATLAWLTAVAVPLPNGRPGIGFDDLRYSSALHALLVPAGRTGQLDLVDPDTGRARPIGGFSAKGAYLGGHDFGVTSVDEGRGLLFATDRTAQRLDVVDPSKGSIVAFAKLARSPDYVRFVASTGELWVTEPEAQQIELFSLPEGATPTPRHVAFVSVPGGPEALAIDPVRKRAYANLWKGRTVAIDLATRRIVGDWPNGCTRARGLALDAKRGWLFAGCDEGKATVLDLQNEGAILSVLQAGAGLDVIDYSASLGHLYLPGAASATMTLALVSASGRLSLLGTVRTARGSHCVTVDDRGQAWVCDPAHGQLLRFRDEFPASVR